MKFGFLASLAALTMSSAVIAAPPKSGAANNRPGGKAPAQSTVPVRRDQPVAQPAERGNVDSAGKSSDKTVAGVPIDKATPKEKQAAATESRAGKMAFERKDFGEALAKFRGSYAIVASPKSRMMIARSLAQLGRTVDAYHEAQATLIDADAAAATNPNDKKTADEVRDEIAEIEKKIAIVTVKVTGVPDEATLTVAGQVIESASWSKPIALPPGAIEVVLKSPDGVARQTVSAAAGAKITVPIEMPRARVADEKPPPPEPKRVSAYHGPDRQILGYSAAGVGAVGMLLFGTFGALSNGQYSRIETGCPTQLSCDPALADVASRGKTYQNVANGMLAVGLLGLAAGAGLIIWNGLDGGGWPLGLGAITHGRLAIGAGQATLSGDF